jgi:hypothetical protein
VWVPSTGSGAGSFGCGSLCCDGAGKNRAGYTRLSFWTVCDDSFALSGLARFHLLPTAYAPSAPLRAGCGLHSAAVSRLEWGELAFVFALWAEQTAARWAGPLDSRGRLSPHESGWRKVVKRVGGGE